MSNLLFPNQLRIDLGLSAAELTKLCGARRSQLSMIEIGERSIPIPALAWLRILDEAKTEAENTTENIFLDTAELNKLWEKQEVLLKNRQRALEIYLEKAKEQAAPTLLLAKTYHFWKDKPKPEQNEEAEMKGLEFAVMARRALQKYQALQISISKYQIELAGIAAELAEIERQKTFLIRLKIF
jgi:transcriptional regulator with XRE-family HTH domain